MKNTWKKAAAFVLAFTLVAGAMPANVGGFLKGRTGIVANAYEFTADYVGVASLHAGDIITSSVHAIMTSGEVYTVTLQAGGYLALNTDTYEFEVSNQDCIITTDWIPVYNGEIQPTSPEYPYPIFAAFNGEQSNNWEVVAVNTTEHTLTLKGAARTDATIIGTEINSPIENATTYDGDCTVTGRVEVGRYGKTSLTINGDLYLAQDSTLAVCSGSYVIVNGNLTYEDRSYAGYYNNGVIIITGTFTSNIIHDASERPIVTGLEGLVYHPASESEAEYFTDSENDKYVLQGSDFVSVVDISNAVVNLAEDNSVASLTIGNDIITDLSGYDITYGTDDSHTATSVPTEPGTYYAYVTPDGTDTAYRGTAKSSSIVVQHVHSYGQPTWSWGDDHKHASAEFVCTSDDDTQTVDAVVTYVIQGNTVIYTATATFDGIEYTDTQEVVNEDVIKVQSDDVDITSKQEVTFSVGAAEGCEYQWYYRKSENDQWIKLKTDDSTSPSLTLVGNSSRDGYQFCCKVTNGEVSEKSEIVTLNYDGLITKHPTDVTIYSNQNATFEVEAENGCTYQWYYRKDKNDKWRKVKTDDSTSASLTMAVNSSKDGYQYRCKVTKGEVSEVSKTVTLNFNSLITMQPEDQTVGVNEDAVFNVDAIDDCSYQWYYRKSETDKWIKLKTANSTSPSLTFKGTYTRDGYQFRCKVMNDDAVSVSDIVTLNILD
jgi:hypothetical protein